MKTKLLIPLLVLVFSKIIFSSDLQILQIKLACLSGQPTTDMIKRGVYRAIISHYSVPNQMFWTCAAFRRNMRELVKKIHKNDPESDCISEFNIQTIAQARELVEQLCEDEIKVNRSPKPAIAGIIAPLIQQQRNLVLKEIARQKAFENDIKGLKFAIENWDKE